MSRYVMDLNALGGHLRELAGGKGANLGELMRIEGVQVPPGFCVTTVAYEKTTAGHVALNGLLHRLSQLTVSDRSVIVDTSAKIRSLIENLPIPDEIGNDIIHRLLAWGPQQAFAIRSSATAEDLPNASFAGQQDTFLNIRGTDAVLTHIRKCWASLFTERAVLYRLQNNIDHHQVQPAVVVQQMVFPQVSGILFTADPVTGHRKILSIDAGLGLGEALVSGRVNPDVYRVREGAIFSRKIAAKQLGIFAAPGGGTFEQAIDAEQQNRQALTDEQILELARLGQKAALHFGSPQDLEWCLADGVFYLVQSRPITTLFPLPVSSDSQNRVYLSVGHQQMMTDAMKPLGLSFYLLTTRAPMCTAGGRLFVDITPMLATQAGRQTLIGTLGKSDPLIRDALQTLVDRQDFIPPLPEEKKQAETAAHTHARDHYHALNAYDPAVVSALITRSETAVEALKEKIGPKSGEDLLDCITDDIALLKKLLTDEQSLGIVFTGINALAWINEKMQEWLGEKNAGDTLAQSVPGNITSEMGLALLDVADAIRPYPRVVAYLQQVGNRPFLDELPQFEGGEKSRAAIASFLQRYGMRCAGEIDLTKTRWSENPAMLLPIILGNIKNFAPGERGRKFAQGLAEAQAKEQDLLQRLLRLPGGEQKASETKRMIELLRSLAGYREYPKYTMISHYFVYRQALLREAERLVKAGVLHEKEDIYFLAFEELREVVRTQKADNEIINQRKDDYRRYEKLSPPRVMTSDGEIITGQYRHLHLPAGALAGLPVSAGTIEGRARVVTDMGTADLEEGDILVTVFTDPSWTPLFVAIKGLVTEVGGLMTHGAVIAREYGLPAVVGVQNATRLIKDKDRIRVNGTEGYVEIL